MELNLENKVVLITGGTGGIGSEIVKEFLNEKCVVICLVRNESSFIKLDAQLRDNERLRYDICDLLNYEQIHSKVKEIAEREGAIDVLVNCAGSVVENPFALNEQNDIDSVVAINLTATLYMCQAVLRPMFKQKGGCIINFSSVSAVKKGRGIAVYAGCKAAIETFTRSLSIEVGRKNIRVNCIRPGVIDTDMSNDLLARSRDFFQNTLSLGRAGKPNEIAKFTVFVASDVTASYMTGETIGIDGGIY